MSFTTARLAPAGRGTDRADAAVVLGMDPYRTILDRADAHFRRVLETQPDAMQCRLGCTLCCRGLFEITTADVAVIVEGLRSLPAEVRALLIERSREIVERLHHPDLDAIDPLEKERFFEGAASVEPCPALTADGACSIYRWRPLVCRTFGLPLRDGAEYRGEECELNFTSSSLEDRERAAWDLQWEDVVDPDDLHTVPQAILIAARLLEGESGLR